MGPIIKFLLVFIVLYWFIRSIGLWLLKKRNGQNRYNNSRYQQTRQQRPPTMENQEDRIIDYQRKKFESSEVEDADYIEIK